MAKYLANFELDWNRHKRYRTKREQEELLQEVRSRHLLDFTVWHGMIPTGEGAYPVEKRELPFMECAKYEEGGEIFSVRSSIFLYRAKGRWLFSPIWLPPMQIKLKLTLPDVMLPDPPPPPPQKP